MKKILRYSLVMLFAAFGTSAMAQTVFDIDSEGATMFGLPGESCSKTSTQEASDAGDITADVSATKGDFTLTISAGVPDPETGNVKTPNRIWNASPKLRMYTGTLTIASSGAAIKKVEFTLASQASKAKWGADNSANTGTLDTSAGTIVTWTGNTKNLVITVTANTQISKITINGGDTPQPSVIDATVAQALAAIDALGNGGETTDKYKVTGYVVGDPDFQRNGENVLYGNVNLTIADEVGGTALLTIYRAKGLNNQNFTEEDVAAPIIKAGDQVVFQGTLKKFEKNGDITPELVNGYLISVTAGIHSATIDDDPNAPIYNLKGERVDNSYRGVVIQNGKKKIQK